MKTFSQLYQHHVSGAIARGQAEAVTEVRLTRGEREEVAELCEAIRSHAFTLIEDSLTFAADAGKIAAAIEAAAEAAMRAALAGPARPVPVIRYVDITGDLWVSLGWTGRNAIGNGWTAVVNGLRPVAMFPSVPEARGWIEGNFQPHERADLAIVTGRG